MNGATNGMAAHMRDGMDLTGWVLATLGGGVVVGKVVGNIVDPGAAPTLSPVFAYNALFQFGNGGQVGRVIQVLPLYAMASLRAVTLPDARQIVVRLEDLSPPERREIAKAIAVAEELATSMRATEVGISLVPAMPAGLKITGK